MIGKTFPILALLMAGMIQPISAQAPAPPVTQMEKLNKRTTTQTQ